MIILLLTKITAVQNEVALSFETVSGLYFWQLFLRRRYTYVLYTSINKVKLLLVKYQCTVQLEWQI